MDNYRVMRQGQQCLAVAGCSNFRQGAWPAGRLKPDGFSLGGDGGESGHQLPCNSSFIIAL